MLINTINNMKWIDKPYDREIFEKYQTQLLFLANSKLGKLYLGIKDPREVVKLTQNSFHVYKGKKKIEATFYSSPIYGRKLIWLANALKFGIALPFATQGIPVFALPTFNPDANPETTSVDGYAGNNTLSNWTTKRGAAGNVSGDADASTTPATILCTATVGEFDQVNRGIFLFDTSSITTANTIASATFDVYVTAKPDTLASAASGSLVLSSPASNTAVANADYNIASWTMTVQATDLTIASLTTSARNIWTLNATGLGNISKTGISKFGLVIDFDRTDSDQWASLGQAGITCQLADGANKPQLVVIYTGGNRGYSAFM